MSDFLSRLAGRSMGLAPVVQPFIPAITAPQSIDGALTGQETSREVSEESAEMHRAPAPQVQTSVDGSPRRKLQDAQSASSVPQTGRDHIPQPIAENPSSVRTASLPQLAAALDSTLRLPGAAPDDADRTLPSWDRTLSNSPASLSPVAAAGGPPDRRSTAPAEPPVIRVTIGRVEVRAELSSPKTRHAGSPRSKPAALSLDDYLKQRSEGRR
ncbi:hypothetical protein SBA3_3800007 [Candidatus Sulfopaludibacter sp. SbA3]|nr:hypothetical protein SBA3_3800007 [Candidatus Sulfopaludibacter sp. SbA3]